MRTRQRRLATLQNYSLAEKSLAWLGACVLGKAGCCLSTERAARRPGAGVVAADAAELDRKEGDDAQKGYLRVAPWINQSGKE